MKIETIRNQLRCPSKKIKSGPPPPPPLPSGGAPSTVLRECCHNLRCRVPVGASEPRGKRGTPLKIDNVYMYVFLLLISALIIFINVNKKPGEPGLKKSESPEGLPFARSPRRVATVLHRPIPNGVARPQDARGTLLRMAPLKPPPVNSCATGMRAKTLTIGSGALLNQPGGGVSLRRSKKQQRKRPGKRLLARLVPLPFS